MTTMVQTGMTRRYWRRAVKMLAQSIFRAAKATGRYVDWSTEEHRTDQADAIPFEGDVPPMAGAEHNQRRMVFHTPRELITKARGVSYTRRGMAWVGGRLERRYSFQEVGPRHVYEQPGPAATTFAHATILQAQTPCTYGDWMSEHLPAIALALEQDAVVAPLLLPSDWYAKPYVKRDLETLGIETLPVDRTVSIETATVLNKTRPGHYWTREEARSVIAAMRISPLPTTSGSAIYLSRSGERGEGPKREINNQVTEAAMLASGVRVVRTAGRSREEFIALADAAETVFTDHGSATYNVLYWQTKRIVEFFPPDYWDSAFLFLADGIGIRDYHLWQIDDQTTVEALSARINALMMRPAGGPTNSL